MGSIVDTVVFLGIAFGLSAVGPAFLGQAVGKLYATVLYLALGFGISRLWRKAAKLRRAD